MHLLDLLFLCRFTQDALDKRPHCKRVEYTLESHLPATIRRNFLLTLCGVVFEKTGPLGYVNVNSNDGRFGNRHSYSYSKHILCFRNCITLDN